MSRIDPRSTRFLLLAMASLVAFAVALGYVAWLHPGRETYFRDQRDYESLARNIAGAGVFARSITPEGVVPEPLRTMGYPIFLAVVYRLTADGYPAVALVQALLAATVPLLAYVIAQTFLPRGWSTGVALVVAVYLPFGYYAAVTLADFFAAYLVTLGSAAHLLAVRHQRTWLAVLAGIAFGWAGLTRPALLAVGPVYLLAWALLSYRKHMRRHAVLSIATLGLALALSVGPSVAYTYANFGRIGVVAGLSGIGLWQGYWHGMWSGSTQKRVIAVAGSSATEAEFRERLGVSDASASRGWLYAQELDRRIELTRSSTSRDDVSRYLAVDAEYGRLAQAHIREDLAGYLSRGLVYRTPILFAGEIPLPFDRIDATPRPVLIALWALQAVLAGLAFLGLAIALRRDPSRAVPFAAALLAFWAVHFVFSTEARYGLGIKAWLIVLAVVAVRSVVQLRPSGWRRTAVGLGPSSAGP